MLNKEQIAALSDEEREIFWRMNYRRGYPRSFAVVLGGLVMAIELDPALALGAAFMLWVSLVLLRAIIGPLINRILFPNPLGFDGYVLSLVVGMILPIFGSWFLKWPFVGICTVIAIVRGAPMPETLFAMGGLVLFDLAMTIFFKA